MHELRNNVDTFAERLVEKWLAAGYRRGNRVASAPLRFPDLEQLARHGEIRV
ncbi:hypothetical protein [Nostoc flagelliforme]|uniref:hypothetical protein n=1 Tax=Nostoc flagelliforme TaxID=1306274 RepID=UPI0012FE3505|nr:hypothetical protein [Nostoc flagelliforme]